VKDGPEEGHMESEDVFVRQTRGLVRFYGAVLQYHDVPAAWHYIACFANTMPANIFTGTALVAFLETAGYALSVRYGRQFTKLLQVFDPTSKPHRPHTPNMRSAGTLARGCN
jgi:hypothetical protein